MQHPQESRPRARSPFTAAFLSLLFPGLGHLYAGAPTRALGFAALPILLLALVAGLVIRMDRLQLLGAFVSMVGAIFVFNLLALARLFSGRGAAGLEAAVRALQVRPNWWTSLEVIICCYAALEKWDEARRYAHELSRATKQPVDVLAPLKTHNPRWANEMKNALQRAQE